MRCFPFSKSETRTSDHRHRFSWKFFSQNNSASDSKKSEKSAPSSSSLSQTKLQGRQTQTAEATVSVEPRRIDDDDDESPSLMQSTSQRPPEPRAFMYEELREATHNFSRVNLLGEGGFGCVYKGLLKHQNPNGPYFSKEVAVKQLNKKGQQGHKEWLTEVHFLGLVEHPNLVKLVGYCAEDDERGIQRLLVYEYMVNGSLEGHLFGKGPSVLSWQERLHIMLGAAHGLAYLHEEINGIQVIFRDFKTSNVLLDKDFTPKLSDFGLARQGPETGASHVSTSVVGTFGYAAPEYVQTGHLTAKSDVWSFGVVLLEMLSGRRSMDRNRPKNEQQLLEWVRPYINVNKKFHYIMDPRLEGKYSLMQAQKVAELALQCLNRYPRTRPIMSVVVEKLKEISEVPESGSPQLLDVVSTTSTDSAKVTSRVKEETKESACSKRRRLIFRDVRNRVWAPKVVQV